MAGEVIFFFEAGLLMQGRGGLVRKAVEGPEEENQAGLWSRLNLKFFHPEDNADKSAPKDSASDLPAVSMTMRSSVQR